MPVAVIESLDHEGRGISRVDGKALFIEGALPGETVSYRVLRERPRYLQAEVETILERSALRVEPRCRHFGICGGCSMQHCDHQAQLAVKQRILEDALWHIGRIKPELIYPAIQGPAWSYRQRARLSVRLVPSKGGVLVGFHQKRSSYIADLDACPVLPQRISALLPAVHELIASLSIPERLPQIEVAASERVTVLVLRHLLPFNDQDRQRLRAFARQHDIRFWLQPGGPESAAPLEAEDERALEYTLPEFNLKLAHLPTDFTQVNLAVNRVLVRCAMQLLSPGKGECIADLFCGVGNFSLPIARAGARVVGIEGSAALVERAQGNATANGLQSQCVFHQLDLFDTTADSLAALDSFDAMLLDPPREGAIAVVKAISPRQRPRRIVYVSCNPATLARDAAVLVHEKGYRLRGAGVADMFPHTSHVESIALFELEQD